MRKLIAWTFLAVIVASIAGLAVSAEMASAQSLDLDCDQTVDPTGPGTLGEVTCQLNVTDLPDPLSDISLTLVATYIDVDGSGDPSPGDQLQCVAVTGTTPGGEINASFCRPGVPDPLTPPGSP